jgi:hypothetical protein
VRKIGYVPGGGHIEKILAEEYPVKQPQQITDTLKILLGSYLLEAKEGEENEVKRWLRTKGLSQYAPKFKTFNWEELSSLSKEDIRNSVGDIAVGSFIFNALHTNTNKKKRALYLVNSRL